ncbi:MAG: helix-turn-helix domain-containing protein [Oscillospiraceae bacterium]|jgi:DNA binding domain, excisionase family|nr:helix-turn-helix domain-containing protein [Oscillospiraceae bacterium]
MLFTQYPDLMSITDLRGALGVGRTKAYELVSSGEIRSIRVGNAIRIPKTSLLDYVKGSGYNVDNADERRYREGGRQ